MRVAVGKGLQHLFEENNSIALSIGCLPSLELQIIRSYVVANLLGLGRVNE